MTLIAAYRIGKVPALLADVLITGRSSGAHSPIATRVDLDGPMPLDWHVTVNGLTRKTAIICENMAIAVAGNGFGAAAVVANLSDRFAKQMPGAIDLSTHLQSIDVALSEATKCTVVGWLIDGDQPRSFRWVSSEPRYVDWDQDYIAGTGASLLKAMAWSDAQPEWDISSFDQAQHYALMQISSLLVNELTNGISVANWFGGGYDLLLWVDGRFQLASDVSFLVLSLDWLQSPYKAINGPGPILIRQMELEDCLVVRAILPRNNLGVTSDIGERTAIIAPITSIGKQHQFARPHRASEVPLFADRTFAIVLDIDANGQGQHWAGGIWGAEAALFGVEQVAGADKLRFYLPTAVLDGICRAATRQLRGEEI